MNSESVTETRKIITFYLKRRSVHYEILKEEQKCHILFWTFCHAVFLNSGGATPKKSNVVDEVVLFCSQTSCSFFFFLEAKREHIHLTKSKLAPLQRRSVLDDLVLSLKSLKSSCEFHIPFKRRMINFWMTFWSIISELNKTVLLSLKGKHLKCFFLKRRSVRFHTLKGRTTNVKFCVGFIFSYPLETKRKNVGVGKTACFEFEKLLFFPFYFPKARLRCWFEFKGRCYFFWMVFWLIIFDFRLCYRKKNIWELVWERSLLFILNDDQVHSTFLQEEPITSSFVLRDFAINHLCIRALSHVKRKIM